MIKRAIRSHHLSSHFFCPRTKTWPCLVSRSRPKRLDSCWLTFCGSMNWMNTFNFQSSSYFCFFQRYPAAAVQLQGDGDPAGHGGGWLGRPPGRRANLRHLPQDQVRRRLREPVFVLPDQVLRPLWGASLPEIQHGKREGVTVDHQGRIIFVT